MKYAIRLTYENGQVAYLDVKGRSSWKTKRAAAGHLAVCQTLMAKNRFLRGVVSAEIEKDFFA